MSDRTAFYKAIWAAPDDDLPRMVFADWLDEHDDPDAAHFLRLLCACRTCPPDVDQLRPLVAQLRRTMVKLPPEFVENACPVPPAVVIGPWVDVDRLANHVVLDFIRMRRRTRSGGVAREELRSPRPDLEVRWEADEVVKRLWEELAVPLSPAAACAIEGMPALVDVWSGVIMAAAAGWRGYILRVPSDVAGSDHRRQLSSITNWHGGMMRVSNHFGLEWVAGDDSVIEEHWLSQVAAEFDPANRPE
jgi:uncharacterized protein (TIGR02996 family)